MSEGDTNKIAVGKPRVGMAMLEGGNLHKNLSLHCSSEHRRLGSISEMLVQQCSSKGKI